MVHHLKGALINKTYNQFTVHEKDQSQNKHNNLKWKKYIKKKQEFPVQSSDIYKCFTDNCINNLYIFVQRSERKYCLHELF